MPGPGGTSLRRGFGEKGRDERFGILAEVNGDVVRGSSIVSVGKKK